MRFFRRQPSEHQHLEDRLRNERPEPRSEFLRSLTMQVRGQADRPEAVQPSFRYRAALAVAVTAILLVAAAVFGGIGYASSAGSHTAGAITHVFSSNKSNGPSSKHGSFDPSHKQYVEFVFVCLHVPPHHPIVNITLRLPQVAANVLIRQGLATPGPC